MAKELDNIRLQMLKKFGPNSIITGRDMEKATYGRISTGSISLDLKIGGGIPIGRMIQIAGAKSSTKSTLCDYIIKNAQNMSIDWKWVERKEVKGREQVEEHKEHLDELICGYLDVEGTKVISWSGDKIGVDTSKWVYAKPSGMEETLNMAHELQKLGVHLIVIDSVDALQSLKDFEAETGESTQMGIKPKAIGEYCRKFTATNNKLVREGHLPCTVILINQVREKIGTYGSPDFTPGGKAIDFYTSIDLRLRRGDWLTIGKGDNKEIVGQVVKFKSLKNKTYKQQQDGSYDFYFEDADICKQGQIDNFKEVILEGAEWGIIERAGAWFRFKGQNLAQGMDNTVNYLRENLDVFIQVKDALFTKVAEEEAHLLGDVKGAEDKPLEEPIKEEPKKKTKTTKSKAKKKK